jgi:hypothetical protein
MFLQVFKPVMSYFTTMKFPFIVSEDAVQLGIFLNESVLLTSRST